MGSSQKHNPFSDQGNLSPEEIARYIEGNLTNQEKHAIEKKMAADDFHADAVEGFQKFPDSLAGMESLKKQIRKSGATGSSFHVPGSLMMAASAALLIAVSTLLYFYFTHSEDLNRALYRPVMSYLEKKNQKIPDAPKELDQTIRKIDEAELLPKNQQITLREVIKNQPDLPAQTDEEVADKITSISIEDVGLAKQEATETLNFKTDSGYNYPTVYSGPGNGLVVVDYSKAYSGDEKESLKKVDASGVSTIYENKAEAERAADDSRFDTRDVPYKDYLDEALTKYGESDYKEALKDYLLILEQKPGDNNALFYGGLCYYNLNMPDNAIAFFDQILNSPINVFHQESRWYKALSLIQKGENEQAGVILQQIVDKKEFYASKAKKKLKEINR
jgi:hypothetical protein